MDQVSGTWIDSKEVAALLRVTPDMAHWYARRGSIVRVTHGGRYLFDKASVAAEVERRAADATRWISYAGAASLVGCSRSTIGNAVSAGEILRRERDGHGRGGPAALDLTSVRAFRQHWAARQREALQRAAEQAAKRVESQSNQGPPKDGDVWLDAGTTAIVMGISVSRVKQLARGDRLPFVRRGRQLWFRRGDVEQVAAAREFTAERRRLEASTEA